MPDFFNLSSLASCSHCLHHDFGYVVPIPRITFHHYFKILYCAFNSTRLLKSAQVLAPLIKLYLYMLIKRSLFFMRSYSIIFCSFRIGWKSLAMDLDRLWFKVQIFHSIAIQLWMTWLIFLKLHLFLAKVNG